MQAAVETALADTPVVCVLGARQVGKSTLVKHMAPGREYMDLDWEPFAGTAREDPAGFIQGLPLEVTLDEVQRVPELMRAIKVEVDRNRAPGRFLLTGSANLLLLPQLTDSLAGRMEIIRLHPLAESEKEGNPGGFLQWILDGNFKQEIRPVDPDGDKGLVGRVLSGGFPGVFAKAPRRASAWWRQYLESILEKDVKDVANVQDVDALSRLLETLACQTGELLNISNLHRDLRISRPTLDHYMAVLQRLYMVRVLPAWERNQAKRLVKTPKVHIPESGLAGHLMGLGAGDWIRERPRFGHLLETFVIQQVAAQAGWTDPDLKLFHYRDKDKVEVDCVVTRGNQVWGMEVKASQSVGKADAKGLRRLAEQSGGDFQGGVVLYTGSSVVRLGDERFWGVPLAKLWEM